ncbi:cytochrome c3 family protein [Amphritea sp. HPY]|uniref:cytochrome c3 family protein n=1 Tax=Amphritea sp. HPY TaxID=3421652 RepID=UPI003D7D58B9
MSFKVSFFAICLLLTFVAYGAEYTGSQQCIACHEKEFELWSKSHHAKSMAEATKSNVLGSFSNVNLEFHGIDSFFYSKGHDGFIEYFVKTINQSGVEEDFKVKYTFGNYPLQQYLVEFENGHIQALNIAWDSRDEALGGQRWFNLQPSENITTEHPFFWTRHFQNWNNRCASCHSTNVEKNYDPINHTYSTTFSEISVSCESCHGPASEHIKLANEGALIEGGTGFDLALPKKTNWQFMEGDAIAKAAENTTAQEINMCARCHSLRTPITKQDHAKDFFDSNILQPLNSPHYFDDGQMREEVFVLGSFMQSKMFQNGVTCSDCHNPHSGQTIVTGNGLCTQCHNSNVYDTSKHHHHPTKSSGSQCVNCHMPERTYMGVDQRRDHSFTTPRPRLSIDLGVPNACVSCHSNQDNSWALKYFEKWGDNPGSLEHWGYAHQQASDGDVLATRQVIISADDEALPDYIRASLLSNLASIPSRVSVEFAQNQLTSESSLLRKAAIASLQNLPAQTRWEILAPYLNDDSQSVRFQLAETLADLMIILPEDLSTKFRSLIDEYRYASSLTNDSPATRLNLANLEIKLGNIAAAEQNLLSALRIEPNYVPAIINMADFYRRTGRENKIEPLLKRALAVAPDSGAANHSYGLFLVRNKKHDLALPYLEAATKKQDATPRFSFVFAIALVNDSETELAVDVLSAANRKWNHQFDLLMLQINLLETLGRQNEIFPYLSKLSAIAPGSPEVNALVKKYR